MLILPAYTFGAYILQRIMLWIVQRPEWM